MTFPGLFELLFGGPAELVTTIFAFFCVTIFCFIFQVGFLRNTKETYGIRLSPKHFILVYVFLFYLMMVYRVVGVGTIWTGRSPAESFARGQVHLIPFTNLSIADMFNIIMTIPLGFLLPAIWSEFCSLKKVTLTAFFFSLTIELSQLFNNRATTMNDLIFNTLGAIIGYLIFRLIYMVIFRQSSGKPYEIKHRASARRIKHEAIIYLLCAFFGMVLLFNPSLPLRVVAATPIGSTYVTPNAPTDLEQADTQTNPELPPTAEHSILGFVVAISEDNITVQQIVSQEISPDEQGFGATEYQEIIQLTEKTRFELWEHDGQQIIRQIEVSKHELFTDDRVDIYGFFEDGEFFAEIVVISRQIQ